MERRRSTRSIVSFDAAFRPRQGLKFPVGVVDLSREGACMDAGFILEDGSEGWLQLPTLSDWASYVVWQHRTLYGLEFAKPFHTAVMTTILARAGAEPSIAVAAEPEHVPVSRSQGSRREQILSGIAVPPTPPTFARRRPLSIGRRLSTPREGLFGSRHRREDRHYPIGRTAGIHLHGRSSEAAIVNVSRSGLAVKSPVRPYIGQTVGVELPHSGVHEGTVTWWRDGRFGVHLASPPIGLVA